MSRRSWKSPFRGHLIITPSRGSLSRIVFFGTLSLDVFVLYWNQILNVNYWFFFLSAFFSIYMINKFPAWKLLLKTVEFWIPLKSFKEIIMLAYSESIVTVCQLVVSTSAFLVFFLAFSYRWVYFQWHSHCAPPLWYYVIADQKL